MNRKAAGPDCTPGGRAQPRPSPEETVTNDSTRVLRRPRRAWQRPARIAAAIIATAALAARRACQHLYPSNGGSFQQLMLCENTGDCPQAVVQQALTEMRSFARCMRSHGVPNWPDPTIDSQGRPFFDVSRAGLSHAYTHSPLVESKDRECGRQVGGSAGVPVPMG